MSEAESSPLPSPDARAAHEFLFELRTRIATRELPYKDGVEETALKSLHDLFKTGREIVRKHAGCERAAERIARTLNDIISPVTAKWHRLSEEGMLGSRDGGDAFRGELADIQSKLRQEARELHRMAYGEEAPWNDNEWGQATRSLDRVFADLPFGVETKNLADTALASTFVAINQTEQGAVSARRRTLKIARKENSNAFGLALSGGGIRSAVFSLGVIQVLAEKGLLDHVDFLSTVSGGGYTGSFITRRIGEASLGGGPSGSGQVKAPNGPDTDAIRYLRLNARYLSGDRLAARWLMVCQTAAGMILNWTVPFLVILTLALVAQGLGWESSTASSWRLGATKVVAGLTCLALVAFGLGLRCGGKIATVTGWIFAGLSFLTGIGFLTHWMDNWFLNWPTKLAEMKPHVAVPSLIGGVAATLTPAIIRFIPFLKSPKIRKIFLTVTLLISGLVVPLAGLLLFYALITVELSVLAIIGGILLLLAMFAIDINKTGPRRMYQECLARTFIQRRPEEPADIALKDINALGIAPYQILNAALNVPASTTAALKERGCDFFMFSKGWTGSPSTGYRQTSDWKSSGRDLELATAMATSGAAASAHMGLASISALTALLTLLNVRLGFWVQRPSPTGSNSFPGFLCLLKEMTSIGMSERSTWLNLSDGGHIENMGVYELLRRRCKYILCVDGEADPDFHFGSLMTLIRHARIDFGVQINPALGEIRPDPKTGLSRNHFQLCEIDYGEGAKGLFLYLKLSVTGNESELIRSYRDANTDFPHQSTLDQFFDQAQFEAYRSLGAHAAESLFKPALLHGPSIERPLVEPTGTGHGDPLETWFRQLSRSLL